MDGEGLDLVEEVLYMIVGVEDNGETDRDRLGQVDIVRVGAADAEWLYVNVGISVGLEDSGEIDGGGLGLVEVVMVGVAEGVYLYVGVEDP